MPLEPKHKFMIGGASTVVIVFLVINGIFLYSLYIKQNTQYTALNQKLSALQNSTQSQINQLSTSLLETKYNLTSLGSQVNSINSDISNLKASVSSDFSSIIGTAIKSVVTIKTDIAQGTGFFIADGGYIVTNQHVINGASAAAVITYDGQSHNVGLIGQDSTMDIALLKIDSTSYPPLTLGNSNDVQIGEKVIAIGNPLGLQFSASEGIISGTDRTGSNGLPYYIQTDAALNPGNSGGPLIDTNGDAIGINNFKISSGESLGFALESNYIKQTINNIAQSKLGSNLI